MFIVFLDFFHADLSGTFWSYQSWHAYTVSSNTCWSRVVLSSKIFYTNTVNTMYTWKQQHLRAQPVSLATSRGDWLRIHWGTNRKCWSRMGEMTIIRCFWRMEKKIEQHYCQITGLDGHLSPFPLLFFPCPLRLSNFCLLCTSFISEGSFKSAYIIDEHYLSEI